MTDAPNPSEYPAAAEGDDENYTGDVHRPPAIAGRMALPNDTGRCSVSFGLSEAASQLSVATAAHGAAV